MRPRLVVLAGLVALSPAVASALPPYCEHALEREDWPVAGEPQGDAPTTPFDHATARRLVGTFRRGWRRLTVPRGVLRDFGACLLASLEHFVVRRVETATL